jgi:hypothetical protein
LSCSCPAVAAAIYNPAGEAGDILLPVVGESTVQGTFEALCPPGQWITSFQGTVLDLSLLDPSLIEIGTMLSSIHTIGCSKGALIPGAGSVQDAAMFGAQFSKNWTSAPAPAGFSGLAVALWQDQFGDSPPSSSVPNITLYGVNSSSQAIGYNPQIKKVGLPFTRTFQDYNLLCPAGMRLAGIHGQFEYIQFSSMGAVCRPGKNSVGRIARCGPSCRCALMI